MLIPTETDCYVDQGQTLFLGPFKDAVLVDVKKYITTDGTRRFQGRVLGEKVPFCFGLCSAAQIGEYQDGQNKNVNLRLYIMRHPYFAGCPTGVSFPSLKTIVEQSSRFVNLYCVFGELARK